MKIITYKKLYEHFLHVMQQTRSEALRNLWRTRNLPPEFKTVIYHILENNPAEYRDFKVNEVTLTQLVNDEDMKPVQAVFFLDWLRREPYHALNFLASHRLKSPFERDEDVINELKAAYERNKKGNDHQAEITPLVPEDSSEQDIEVDVVSENEGAMVVDYSSVLSDNATSIKENKASLTTSQPQKQ